MGAVRCGCLERADRWNFCSENSTTNAEDETHVGLYLGRGMVIHAKGRDVGVVVEGESIKAAAVTGTNVALQALESIEVGKGFGLYRRNHIGRVCATGRLAGSSNDARSRKQAEESCYSC